MKLFVTLRVLERSSERASGIRTGVANQRHCVSSTPRGSRAHARPSKLRPADVWPFSGPVDLTSHEARAGLAYITFGV
jgi:hypothetical protein